MHRPYYYSTARQQHLIREAESWRHTPFGKGPGVKGIRGGVDCIRLVVHLHRATGAAQVVDGTIPAKYPLNWSAHNKTSLLERWLEANGWLQFDAEGKPQSTDKAIVVRRRWDLRCGDLALFAPGAAIHHIETVLSPHSMVGALHSYGVRIGGWESPLPRTGKTIASVFQYGFRIIENA